tara:strand:- start:56 stop:409 length:354 start_codon:yes stop_codon:yes gene_type:complete
MDARDRLLKRAGEFGTRTVDIPEWDETLTVRSLTLAEKSKVAQAAVGGELDIGDRVADWIVACVVDPTDREPIFHEEDRASILDWESVICERLAEAIADISGLNVEDDPVGRAGEDS